MALPAYERLAAAGRVDGFLLTDIEAGDPRFALLEAAGVPVVLAGRPAGRRPFPWVETRHDEGIAPAVEHLVALGHDRIAFFSGHAEFEHQRLRETAWRSALAAAGLAPGPLAHVVHDQHAAAVSLLREARPRSSARATPGVRGLRRRAGARRLGARTTSAWSGSTTRRWRRTRRPR